MHQFNLSPQDRLDQIASIIELADNRCAACDGPVPPTLEIMEQAEISRIYALAKDNITYLKGPTPSERSEARATPARSESEDIKNKVFRDISDHLGINLEKIRSDSHFDSHLYADSLDRIEIIMAIEETFDIEIPNHIEEKIKTVGNLVDAVTVIKK